ncbi:MAG TPA: AAA family ATPase [Elusimicrobiales bacterium]|nr:AAA family ATPase [Elusimicrobiales bacterium]
MPQFEIEFNPQFSKALHMLENGTRSVFVTGKAGTGKSTLLLYFRAHTAKKIVVLAPTGVAALNVGGETIHSFFAFQPGITPGTVKQVKGKKALIYKELDALVIDEVSMARADLMDCVDAFMRLNGRDPALPFGGAQLILIGDLYQLPPVVTAGERELFRGVYNGPYFFSAAVFKELELEFVELEKIYRQTDSGFIAILNSIRNNSITPGELAALNRRVGAPQKKGLGCAVQLLTTNAAARALNLERLAGLPGREYRYAAQVTGDFGRESYPAEELLRLKRRAQVMLLNNDPDGRWVNGTMAEVAEIIGGSGGEPDHVLVRLPGGELEGVFPHDWELLHFTYNHEAGRIDSEAAGVFRQYPLKLAWGVTIHKSQGKTFERVTLDLGDRAFAAGQTYVGLSRCVSLEGLSLARPVRGGDVITDRRIVDFVTAHQYKLSDRDLPLAMKVDLINRAIKEGKCLGLTYLRAHDERSRRRLRPVSVGECRYQQASFTGLRAHCLDGGPSRLYRVDRILEMEII